MGCLSLDYSFGYQGSEKDDEIKGEGNSYTTQFRQLDVRIGRWLSLDPKANATESPYVSMGNNPIVNKDPYGDTIRRTLRFDKAYYNSYQKFAESDAGKIFIKDYGVGGQYEHISVVFDLDDKGKAGEGGHTDATAQPRKGKDFSPIALDFPGKIAPEKLISNENEDYYLRFTIKMNPSNDVSLDPELLRVGAGGAILHETQHVVLGILGLKNTGSVPTPESQHDNMRDEFQHYYWDRVNYWWQNTPTWYNDFKKIQKESWKGLKDKNKLNYYPTIFSPMDYINNKEQFLD